MVEKIKKKIKEKKGSYSIISVIVVFIVVLAITAFADITSKAWTLNEVQSIMDISGVNALQSTIDTKILRDEIFGTDKDNGVDTTTGNVTLGDYKTKIVNKFIIEMNKYVKTNNNIVAFNVERADVDFTYNDTWGLGDSAKKRPQIVLDTVSTIRIKNSSKFDTLNGITKSIYSSRNNNTFTVTYAGTKEDGTIELIIRSVTRIVYR
ncbi:TPA: hypothetical protein N2D99_002365 [Clostridium botulinum]|nr:hypothetical protein [Clostridium botulinum]